MYHLQPCNLQHAKNYILKQNVMEESNFISPESFDLSLDDSEIDDETLRFLSSRVVSGNTISAASSSNSRTGSVNRLPIQGKHSYPCNETYSPIPQSLPSKWPQRPILLRPSHESGMKIRGIRYSSSTSDNYLPLPGTGYCLGCTLPINNGTEPPGKCLVIDFETDLFIGTAMLRIKNVSGAFAKTLNETNNDGSIFRDADEAIVANDNEDASSTENTTYYFHKRKRTCQAIVHGKFKRPNIPMSECITGQMFHRPAGKLPPRLIVKGAISIISHLAPQLQAKLDGDRPRFLSPLVSTAQSVIAHRGGTKCGNGKKDTTKFNVNNDEDCVENVIRFIGADESLEAGIYEPQPSHPSSLLQDLINSEGEAMAGMAFTLPPDSNKIATRTKHRKRAYDKLFAKSIKTPTFDIHTEYKFEFFQHLISFEDFALDFLRPVGKQPLHGMLNGQPLKFMAAHQVKEIDIDGKGKEAKVADEEMRWLWCFDLWHESLYEDAYSAHGDER